MTNYICILDFEATCWEDKRFPNEIIEFPSILLKWEENPLDDISKRKQYTIQEISRIQLFVKPAINPIVSDFCNELTGISQKQVDAGIDLKSAIETHLQWITHIVPTDQVTIVTHGDWDLKIMLPMDLKNISYEPNEIYNRYTNIKDLFNIIVPERDRKAKSNGLIKMLGNLKLKPEGRHHSGIDDCHNIARIFIKLVDMGLNKTVFANNMKSTNKDYDVQKDNKKTKKDHNKKHGQKYNKRHNIN
jgi:inhibitor of KinA sporulation pathway (predicted exonuclease)